MRLPQLAIGFENAEQARQYEEMGREFPALKQAIETILRPGNLGAPAIILENPDLVQQYLEVQKRFPKLGGWLRGVMPQPTSDVPTKLGPVPLARESATNAEWPSGPASERNLGGWRPMPRESGSARVILIPSPFPNGVPTSIEFSTPLARALGRILGLTR